MMPVHVQEYLAGLRSRGMGTPEYVDELTMEMGKLESFNFLYKVRDLTYVHVVKTGEGGKYFSIEPSIDESVSSLGDQVMDALFREFLYVKDVVKKEEFSKKFDELFSRAVSTSRSSARYGKIYVPEDKLEPVRHYLVRNILELGTIQPLLYDPYIEDIFAVGPGNMSVVHKIFGVMETNVSFKDLEHMDRYLRSLTERVGKPVSISNPVVDIALPDGSRANIIYSDDISVKGPSFSIRRVPEEPISVTQLVKWNTISDTMAAYFWLCLEHGMSLMFCGPSACGKTSTLNSLLPFIRHNLKIYSVEDTKEVTPPHRVWQRLLTRESGPEESRVMPFDLLRAALRSRPNYIIVGEIRGREGNVAFQAMQTGHPVIGTFHASSVPSMIQRFTSDPINVPPTFIDNLNVSIIQSTIMKDGKPLRRVVSVGEIVGYSKESQGVMIRYVFGWDPVADEHRFRGMNNSYILENKIAAIVGYADKRLIYHDLEERRQIIRAMIDNGILKYRDVVKTVAAYYLHGVEGLPFRIGGWI